MIIVQKKGVTRFFNEKEYECIINNKDTQSITAVHKNGECTGMSNVESVIYVSDSQPFQFEDNGTPVENLQKELDEVKQTLKFRTNAFNNMDRDFLHFVHRCTELVDGTQDLKYIRETANHLKSQILTHYYERH